MKDIDDQIEACLRSHLDDAGIWWIKDIITETQKIIADACEPRSPNPEWFGPVFDEDGKSTGKWDSWWFSSVGVLRACVFVNGRVLGISEAGKSTVVDVAPISIPIECVPVTREGFPAPAGWGVLEKP